VRNGEAIPRTIYLRAVIDTDALPQGPEAAQVHAAPTAVDVEDNSLILTSTAPGPDGAPGASDAAAGFAAISATAGDTLRFYAITGSNNFEDAVLIKEIRVHGGDRGIAALAPVCLQAQALLPGAGADPLSFGTAEQDFRFWQGTVADHGIQDCSLVLALYRRDEAGRPRFAGLYRWDLQLAVSEVSNPDNPEEQTS
jgi:hypothetical protein